jgi:hypothetical protein
LTKQEPTAEVSPPSVRSRLLALWIGIWYVVGVAAVLVQITGMPRTVSFLLVSLGAAVIMAVMVAFGVKAYKQKGPVRQFQLSSLFLLIIPIAIYSTAIRFVVDALPANAGPVVWLMVTLSASFFVVLSTAILLWLADALMWIAVLVVRTVSHIRQSDSET